MSRLMRPIWLSIFFLFTACVHKTAMQRLSDFVHNPSNKIMQQVNVGNITATATWIPPVFRSAPGTGGNENDGYEYFDVKLDNLKPEKPAKEKELYLDFDMQHDFTLVQENDSIPPAICQRIQNGRVGSYEYMLAFGNSAQHQPKNFTLVYNDKMFATGILAFAYKEEDIQKIPTLAAK